MVKGHCRDSMSLEEWNQDTTHLVFDLRRWELGIWAFDFDFDLAWLKENVVVICCYNFARDLILYMSAAVHQY
jgi:hypothetical protein